MFIGAQVMPYGEFCQDFQCADRQNDMISPMCKAVGVGKRATEPKKRRTPPRAPHPLDRSRFEAAMKKSGLERDFHIAKATGIDASLIPRYHTGEKTPDGYNLALLCRTFRVSPAYLFAFDGAGDYRTQILRELRSLLGEDEAAVVELMGKMGGHQRARLLGQAEMLAQEEPRAKKPGTPAPSSGILAGDYFPGEVADEEEERPTEDADAGAASDEKPHRPSRGG